MRGADEADRIRAGNFRAYRRKVQKKIDEAQAYLETCDDPDEAELHRELIRNLEYQILHRVDLIIMRRTPPW